MWRLSIALVLVSLHACGDNLECGDGTAKRGKSCIPAQDLCPAGEVWESGECRPATACGDGTTNVGGRCVPNENLCDAGEVYLDGGCVEQCGAGTLVDVTSGSCVPVDPTDGADPEAEPNDPIFAGVGAGNTISLPAQGQAVRVTGTIDEPTDLDGDGEEDDDFDAFTFDGPAGTRLLVEVTAVGAPEVAFMLVRWEAGRISWARYALPVAERNATRQVVLPHTGSYFLVIGEGTAVAGAGLGWTGGDEFTYVAAITPIANPAPTTTGSGDFEVAGDLADVPQFLLDVTAGTFIEASVVADSSDTGALLWFASATYAEHLGEVRSGLVQVPAGGLLVTADYDLSTSGATGYRLQTIEHPVTTLDLSAPVARLDELVPPGGVRFYGMTFADGSVVHAAADLSTSDADAVISLLDNQLRTVAVSNVDGLERSLTAAVPAGAYTLMVSEVGALADSPGVFAIDLSVETWPLGPLGSGVVNAPFETVELLDIPFAASGDRAYYWVDVSAVGQLAVTSAPSAELDVAVAVHASSLLATANGLETVAFGDAAGAGGDEIANAAVAPRRYFIGLEATGAAPGSDADLTALFVASKTTYVLEGAATVQEPTDLGTLSTMPVFGFGELTRDGLGSTADYWQFTLDSAARVRVETSAYGGATADTLMMLSDARGVLFAFDDDSGVGGYSAFEVELPAGDFVVVASEKLDRELGDYVIEAAVVEELLCASGSTRCDGGGLMVCDTGGQSETRRVCPLGCSGDYCLGIAEAADNDSWTGAQDLDGVGSAIEAGLTVVNGAIDDVVAGRDMDWYTFTLDSAAIVTVSTWAPTELDTEVWIYRANDTPPPDILELANNDDAPGTVFSRAGPETVPAGEYWVRVGFAADRVSQPGAYQLTIDVQPLACFPDDRGCNADTLELCNGDGSALLSLACVATCTDGACDFVLESEPNDGDTQADDFSTVALDTRIPVAGQIDNPSDGDWYRFEIAANALVRIETVPTGVSGDVDTRMSLYASGDTGTAIATDNDGGVGTYSLIDTFLTPDTYFLAVRSSASDSGTYLVVIDVMTPECTGTGTRCAATEILEQCDRGRWVPWSCLTTCGDAPAACEPLSAEVAFNQPFTGPGTVVRRFGAAIGEKLNFVSTPDGSLETQLVLCPVGVSQCDFDNGWLRRTVPPGLGNVAEILDWIVPATGEYQLVIAATAGSGTTEVRVTPVPIPRIASADYPIAALGSQVVLSGTRLADVDAVTVGGELVGFVVDSDTQITVTAIPDTTPIGVAVPVLVSSPTLGVSGPFGLTVIHLLLSEVDANTPGADAAQLVEVSAGFPGLDLTGAGYVIVFVNGADTAPGEAYRSGIALDAVADADGLIVLGNAGVNPDILFNDDLQNGYDGVAIVQAAAITNGSDVTGERIIDAVAYQAGLTSGQVANLDFLWSPGSGVLDEGANGAVESDSLQRCTLGRRTPGAWQVDNPTSGNTNLCAPGSSVNSYAVSGLPANVPSPGTRCFDLVVPALPFGNAISQAIATARLDHTSAGQIDISLSDPGSSTINLITNRGSFYDFVPGFPIVFDDGGGSVANIVATRSGVTLCAASPCILAPEQPLSTFNGAQSVGSWAVCVGDNALPNAGQVHSFELELTTVP